MADSTEAKPISWEAVRALAMVVGVREAARRMHLSEDRVRQRSHREGWLASDSAKQAVRIAHENRTAQKSVTTMSPAALIQAEIAQLGANTRLSIARGIAKAGEHIEQLDGQSIVADAHNVKSVAQTAGLIHSWDRSAAQPKIRLELLASKGEVTAIDIESEVVTDDWADEY